MADAPRRSKERLALERKVDIEEAMTTTPATGTDGERITEVAPVDSVVVEHLDESIA